MLAGLDSWALHVVFGIDMVTSMLRSVFWQLSATSGRMPSTRSPRLSVAGLCASLSVSTWVADLSSMFMEASSFSLPYTFTLYWYYRALLRACCPKRAAQAPATLVMLQALTWRNSHVIGHAPARATLSGAVVSIVQQRCKPPLN